MRKSEGRAAFIGSPTPTHIVRANYNLITRAAHKFERIRPMVEAGKSISEIAAHHGVAYQVIWRIIRDAKARGQYREAANGAR